MKMLNFVKAALVGFAVLGAVPTGAHAEKLRVLTGSPSGVLNVPMNRAVVVESDEPFAEISVANAEIADISTLSDRSIYVLGRTPGLTTMTLLAPDGTLITNVQIQVTPDITEFKERLRQIMPGENIEVRTANDGIVLSGVISSITMMERAVELAERYAPGRVSNLLNIGGTQQVMLKVRFAEMSRSVSKDLSSSLAVTGPTSYDSNGNAVNWSAGETGTFLSGDNSQGGTIETRDGALGAIKLGAGIGSTEVSILLEAMEEKGLVRTLSEPNLTALSGQQAKFLAGGEYPIPVSSSDGIYIDYKPFGVELEFIPRVVNGEQINLELRASVSGVDSTVNYSVDGFTLNSFRRREASTTVELRDGQSFAIAGLLQDDFEDLVGQVPWLGDIPVLGSLFRSTDYSRRQSELVIIVTPHLVSPTNGLALALPTDRVKIPTESELFLFGRTYGGTERAPKGTAAEVAKQDFSGSYGYVME
ncbi:type II and III secretion system protein family protein [Celeribacter litoreus]|uniref:type II and III secretion system protein family protein n=1 Tax=Celeribacter litoreus TaxID=2876714 RepID=UPI001CC9B70A|nr:type II and III secretion system protein family protein [Celeribacter litoreus]MCA0044049.1 type II and III secretion system protein family protein [Celeribacter litoreus]